MNFKTYLLSLLLYASASLAQESLVNFGRFHSLQVYLPKGEPDSVALFVSGDGGWNDGVLDMARLLPETGAMVVGIDIRQYFSELSKSRDKCASLAVDFENLSHSLQKKYGLKDYKTPVLVGYSSGATLVYATLAQAPIGTFAGAISLGFGPDLDVPTSLCPGTGLRYTIGKKGAFYFAPFAALKSPWIVLQGLQDQVINPDDTNAFVSKTRTAKVVVLPLVGHDFSKTKNWESQFRTSYKEIVDRSQLPAVASSAVRGLPLHEVTASGTSDTLAVLLTGDGGWAGLDQELSAQLANRGVPVIGFNSLKYFWTKRSSDEAAVAVANVIRNYLGAWSKQRVILIGYSFGADVLPFIVNRLPDDLRKRIASVNLLGLSTEATFEIHVADWIPGNVSKGQPIEPELYKVSDAPMLCLYGSSDKNDLCPKLSPQRITQEQFDGGHHFGGNYGVLADRILEFKERQIDIHQ